MSGNHIATALYYALPLANEDRIGKGSVLPWNNLTNERADRPFIPAAVATRALTDEVNGARDFTAEEIAEILWNYLALDYGDPGRYKVSYKDFLDKDLVNMVRTTHKELVSQAMTITGTPIQDEKLRYEVARLIRKYQGRSGKRG